MLPGMGGFSGGQPLFPEKKQPPPPPQQQQRPQVKSNNVRSGQQQQLYGSESASGGGSGGFRGGGMGCGMGGGLGGGMGGGVGGGGMGGGGMDAGMGGCSISSIATTERGFNMSAPAFTPVGDAGGGGGGGGSVGGSGLPPLGSHYVPTQHHEATRHSTSVAASRSHLEPSRSHLEAARHSTGVAAPPASSSTEAVPLAGMLEVLSQMKDDVRRAVGRCMQTPLAGDDLGAGSAEADRAEAGRAEAGRAEAGRPSDEAGRPTPAELELAEENEELRLQLRRTEAELAGARHEVASLTEQLMRSILTLKAQTDKRRAAPSLSELVTSVASSAASRAMLEAGEALRFLDAGTPGMVGTPAKPPPPVAEAMEDSGAGRDGASVSSAVLPRGAPLRDVLRAELAKREAEIEAARKQLGQAVSMSSALRLELNRRDVQIREQQIQLQQQAATIAQLRAELGAIVPSTVVNGRDSGMLGQEGALHTPLVHSQDASPRTPRTGQPMSTPSRPPSRPPHGRASLEPDILGGLALPIGYIAE